MAKQVETQVEQHETKKVKFIKVHPRLAHSVGDIVDLPVELIEKYDLENIKYLYVTPA